MNSKKGFTLVELLAVVALVAILAAVATPAITAVSKKSKQKMYDSKIKMIEAAAVMCAEKTNHIESCDYVQDLCTAGYLSVESGATCQKNPVNEEELAQCYIDITKVRGRYVAKFTTKTYNGNTKQWQEWDNCKRD